jgi:hypothetical protein
LALSVTNMGYQKVLPLVEENRTKVQSENLVEADFDREEFLACITDGKDFLESYRRVRDQIEGDRSDAQSDYEALLSKDDMDRILRYEERMHRQMGWAMQRLLEAQERRKTLQSSPDMSVPVE